MAIANSTNLRRSLIPQSPFPASYQRCVLITNTADIVVVAAAVDVVNIFVPFQ